MNLTISEFLDLLLNYRKFELARPSIQKALLKEILPANELKHCQRSWAGRNNDFGSFYLNLSYDLQGAFLINWKVGLIDFDKFLLEFRASPIAYLSTVPPIKILEVNAFFVFFNNHSIDPSSLPDFSFPCLPNEKYGNSTNWGSYLLSLSVVHVFEFFVAFESYCQKAIDAKIATINSFKKYSTTC